MSIANEVQAARTTFETLVEDLEPKGAGLADRLAEQRDGGGADNYEFDMAGAMPQWERWVGTKTFDGWRELSISVPFDQWHKSLKIKRHKVVNDKTGMVGQAMSKFLGNHDYLYDRIVMEKLVSNPTGIDGVSLLSDSHPFGADGGTWDNKTTDALNQTSFDAAHTAGQRLKNEKGEYLELKYDTLIVGPDLQRTAFEVTQADSRPIAVATSGDAPGSVGVTSIANFYQGSATVIVTPRMPTAKWLLLDSSRGLPVGLVVWRDPESHITDDMDGEYRQLHDEFIYSVEADANAVGLMPYGLYGNL